VSEPFGSDEVLSEREMTLPVQFANQYYSSGDLAWNSILRLVIYVCVITESFFSSRVAFPCMNFLRWAESALDNVDAQATDTVNDLKEQIQQGK
jgi:hypothetical protein